MTKWVIPIMISTILVWRVQDTYRASFDVNNFENFVVVQTDAAVRKLASLYPYDNFADEGLDEDITLRSSVNEVSFALGKGNYRKTTYSRDRSPGGQNRIFGLLQMKSQVRCLKDSRQLQLLPQGHKIVEGAVSMVEMALEELSRKEIVILDDESRAAMVSNLMVVLCSDKDAAPIVNAGTLHH
jgi:hypothetical protein